jgi:hypothetical protein
VSEFLKPEGYFKTRFVGKKPIGGLYLEEEYAILTNEWEERNKAVESLYKGLPQTLKVPLPQGSLKQYMAKFNIELKPMIKKIEETARSRITNLLVSSGNGRTKRSSIAKGGNLPEKLRNQGLDLSVRTIGKVMWSPLFSDVSQNTFVDKALHIAHKRFDPTPGEDLSEEEGKICKDLPGLCKTTEGKAAIVGTLSLTANIYLEIYPDFAGTASWDSAIRGASRK